MREQLQEGRKPWNFGKKVFNWKPELHPRDRKGRFIHVFKKLLNLEIGGHYDLDKVIADAPNIRAATAWRNRDGWEVRTQTRQGTWSTQVRNRDLLDNEDIFDDLLMVVNEGENFPESPFCPCGCGNKSKTGGLLPGHQERQRARLNAKAMRGDQKALQASLNMPAPPPVGDGEDSDWRDLESPEYTPDPDRMPFPAEPYDDGRRKQYMRNRLKELFMYMTGGEDIPEDWEEILNDDGYRIGDEERKDFIGEIAIEAERMVRFAEKFGSIDEALDYFGFLTPDERERWFRPDDAMDPDLKIRRKAWERPPEFLDPDKADEFNDRVVLLDDKMSSLEKNLKETAVLIGADVSLETMDKDEFNFVRLRDLQIRSDPDELDKLRAKLDDNTANVEIDDIRAAKEKFDPNADIKAAKREIEDEMKRSDQEKLMRDVEARDPSIRATLDGGAARRKRILGYPGYEFLDDLERNARDPRYQPDGYQEEREQYFERREIEILGLDPEDADEWGYPEEAIDEARKKFYEERVNALLDEKDIGLMPHEQRGAFVSLVEAMEALGYVDPDDSLDDAIRHLTRHKETLLPSMLDHMVRRNVFPRELMPEVNRERLEVDLTEAIPVTTLAGQSTSLSDFIGVDSKIDLVRAGLYFDSMAKAMAHRLKYENYKDKLHPEAVRIMDKWFEERGIDPDGDSDEELISKLKYFLTHHVDRNLSDGRRRPPYLVYEDPHEEKYEVNLSKKREIEDHMAATSLTPEEKAEQEARLQAALNGDDKVWEDRRKEIQDKWKPVWQKVNPKSEWLDEPDGPDSAAAAFDERLNEALDEMENIGKGGSGGIDPYYIDKVRSKLKRAIEVWADIKDPDTRDDATRRYKKAKDVLDELEKKYGAKQGYPDPDEDSLDRPKTKASGRIKDDRALGFTRWDAGQTGADALSQNNENKEFMMKLVGVTDVENATNDEIAEKLTDYIVETVMERWEDLDFRTRTMVSKWLIDNQILDKSWFEFGSMVKKPSPKGIEAFRGRLRSIVKTGRYPYQVVSPDTHWDAKAKMDRHQEVLDRWPAAWQRIPDMQPSEWVEGIGEKPVSKMTLAELQEKTDAILREMRDPVTGAIDQATEDVVRRLRSGSPDGGSRQITPFDFEGAFIPQGVDRDFERLTHTLAMGEAINDIIYNLTREYDDVDRILPENALTDERFQRVWMAHTILNGIESGVHRTRDWEQLKRKRDYAREALKDRDLDPDKRAEYEELMDFFDSDEWHKYEEAAKAAERLTDDWLKDIGWGPEVEKEHFGYRDIDGPVYDLPEMKGLSDEAQDKLHGKILYGNQKAQKKAMVAKRRLIEKALKDGYYPPTAADVKRATNNAFDTPIYLPNGERYGAQPGAVGDVHKASFGYMFTQFIHALRNQSPEARKELMLWEGEEIRRKREKLGPDLDSTPNVIAELEADREKLANVREVLDFADKWGLENELEQAAAYMGKRVDRLLVEDLQIYYGETRAKDPELAKEARGLLGGSIGASDQQLLQMRPRTNPIDHEMGAVNLLDARRAMLDDFDSPRMQSFRRHIAFKRQIAENIRLNQIDARRTDLGPKDAAVHMMVQNWRDQGLVDESKLPPPYIGLLQPAPPRRDLPSQPNYGKPKYERVANLDEYAEIEEREAAELAELEAAREALASGKPAKEVMGKLVPFPSNNRCACGCGQPMSGTVKDAVIPGHEGRYNVNLFEEATRGNYAAMNEIAADPAKKRAFGAWVSKKYAGTPETRVEEVDSRFGDEELAYDTRRVPDGLPLDDDYSPLLDPGPGDEATQLQRLTARRDRAASGVERSLINESMRRVRAGRVNAPTTKRQLVVSGGGQLSLIDPEPDSPDLFGDGGFGPISMIDQPNAEQIDHELGLSEDMMPRSVVLRGTGLVGNQYQIRDIFGPGGYGRDGEGLVATAKLVDDIKNAEDVEEKLRTMGAFVGPSSLGGEILDAAQGRSENVTKISDVRDFSLSIWIPVGDGKYVEYFPQVSDLKKVARNESELEMDLRHDQRFGNLDRLPEFDSPDGLSVEEQGEGFIRVPLGIRGTMNFEGMSSSEIDEFLGKVFPGSRREPKVSPRLMFHSDKIEGTTFTYLDDVADGTVVPTMRDDIALVHVVAGHEDATPDVFAKQGRLFDSMGFLSNSDRILLHRETREGRAARPGALKPKDIGAFSTGQPYQGSHTSAVGDYGAGIDGYVFANLGAGVSYFDDVDMSIYIHPKHLYRDDTTWAPWDWGFSEDRFSYYAEFMDREGGAFGEGLPAARIKEYAERGASTFRSGMGFRRPTTQLSTENEVLIPGRIPWKDVVAIDFSQNRTGMHAARAMKEGHGKGFFRGTFPTDQIEDLGVFYGFEPGEVETPEYEAGYQSFLKLLDRMERLNPHMMIAFGDLDEDGGLRDATHTDLARLINKRTGFGVRLPKHATDGQFDPYGRKIKASTFDSMMSGDDIFRRLGVSDDTPIDDMYSHDLDYGGGSDYDEDLDRLMPDGTWEIDQLPKVADVKAKYRAVRKVVERLRRDPKYVPPEDGFEYRIIPRSEMLDFTWVEDPETRAALRSQLINAENPRGWLPVWYRLDYALFPHMRDERTGMADDVEDFWKMVWDEMRADPDYKPPRNDEDWELDQYGPNWAFIIPMIGYDSVYGLGESV